MTPEPPGAPSPTGLGPQAIAGIALYSALLITFLVFLPGLTGGYLFDDFSNLGGLEKLKAGQDANAYWQYVLHGIASPTGRPISLASFAMQAHDWPNYPAGFLRVNLLLHLLNGCLLFLWLWYLCRSLALSDRARLAIPVATTTLWLLAPIQITGVLYIVQRMTELSATFVFSGLAMYLAGRHSAVLGHSRRGLFLMTLGLGWGGGLGVLAKENAALMPLLVLVVEYTLLTHLPRPAYWRVWSRLFLWAPALILVGYLMLRAGLGFEAYAMREFTLGQRLLTETRVLFMYLHKLLLPWPSATRLLYDDFPLSLSLFQPWTTAASVAGLGGLLALSWRLRRAAPFLAFGCGWFLTAHLLESTVLPLEIVFEHRNYQASAGVWLAVVASVPALWASLRRPLMRRLVAGAGVMYLVLLCVVTVQVSSLWGRPFEMALWNVQQQPDSRRARIELLGSLLGYGFNAEATKAAMDAAERWPDNPSFHLSLLRAACQATAIDVPPVDAMASRVRATRMQVLTTVYLLDSVTEQLELGRCPRVAPGVIEPLVAAAFENPMLAPQRQNLLLLRSRVLRLQDRREEARASFREAIELEPVMILLIQGILDEVQAGNLDAAREYLRRAEQDPRISRLDRWSHRHDIELLRELLASVEAKQAMP